MLVKFEVYFDGLHFEDALIEMTPFEKRPFYGGQLVGETESSCVATGMDFEDVWLKSFWRMRPASAGWRVMRRAIT